jgi:hypothetical protein
MNGLVIELLGHDHMGQRRHTATLVPGRSGQVMRRLDMGRFHQVDAARVDHDQLRALPQPLLQPRGEDRVAVGRVRADDDQTTSGDAVEILRAGGGAEGLAKAVAGGRMADPCAGVGVVVAEHRAGQFLHEEGLLVGAAARGDHADRLAAVFS